jgi:hypothetical protein
MRIGLSHAMGGLALLTGLGVSGTAAAIPTLQLYIEGGTYDGSEESWNFPGHQFRLWAIGNLSGPGGTNGTPITNVRLSAVYDNPGSPVTITITPTLIGGGGQYGGFTDPSLPGAPTLLQTVTNGSTPLIGGSSSLPGHGEYGAGKAWQEFSLGNFTLSDSQVADFVNAFPLAGLQPGAQINAYDITVTGADAHFDLYGQITDSNGRVSYISAPSSHDATDGPASVPVPATFALLGLGLIGLSFLRRRA